MQLVNVLFFLLKKDFVNIILILSQDTFYSHWQHGAIIGSRVTDAAMGNQGPIEMHQ